MSNKLDELFDGDLASTEEGKKNRKETTIEDIEKVVDYERRATCFITSMLGSEPISLNN